MKSLRDILQNIKEAKFEHQGKEYDVGKLFGKGGKFSPDDPNAPVEKVGTIRQMLDLLRKDKKYLEVKDFEPPKEWEPEQKQEKEDLKEYIVKKGNEYAIISKKGKQLGKYSSREQAVKRLRQIEYFKKHGK